MAKADASRKGSKKVKNVNRPKRRKAMRGTALMKRERVLDQRVKHWTERAAFYTEDNDSKPARTARRKLATFKVKLDKNHRQETKHRARNSGVRV